MATRSYYRAAAPVFTSLIVRPDSANIARGGKLRISAEARDQYGVPLATQPAFKWATAAPNTVSALGDFVAASSASGGYDVTVSATVGTVTRSAKARVIITAADLALLNPKGGETFRVGDTLKASWTANLSTVVGVDVFLSPDGGKNWVQLTTNGSLTTQTPGWPSFSWIVTPTVGSISAVSRTCLLRIADYVAPEQIRATTPVPFSIVASLGAKSPLSLTGKQDVALRYGDSKLRVSTAGLWHLNLYLANGAWLGRWELEGPCQWQLPATEQGHGMRILEAYSPEGGKPQRLFVWPLQ